MTHELLTLPRRSALRHRNGFAYATLRSWRAERRAQDLATFKAEKLAKTPSVLSTAAQDLADEVFAMLGPLDGWAVACVACGHSRDPECWGKLLARDVARRLDVPFRQVFKDRFVRGSSHPKEFRHLPPLEWDVRPQGPIVLIDDLVTSGWHMEEALGLLRPLGAPAIGLAWIGGTLTEEKPVEAPAWAKVLPAFGKDFAS